MTPKFITPYYVRVDTPKERQYLAYKLAKIGYDVCPCVTMDKTCSYEPDAVFVFTTEQSVHIIEDRDFSENTVDCGTNAELFLALASMRSDTDKGQCFVYADDIKFKCLSDNAENYLRKEVLSLGAGEDLLPFRRATATEIVEHFSQPTV